MKVKKNVKIMEYGGTAYNRSVYASGLKALGLRNG
jgi:hypothetical protein